MLSHTVSAPTYRHHGCNTCSIWLSSSFQSLLRWEFLNLFRKDTLSVSAALLPSICLFLFLPLFFLPSVSFPSILPVSTPSPSPTHFDIIVHIPTLLPWHTLQYSAYHALALLSTQTHISFHNNNPAPCPRLPMPLCCPFSSIIPSFCLWHTLGL